MLSEGKQCRTVLLIILLYCNMVNVDQCCLH